MDNDDYLLTYKETAERLRITEKTLRNRVSRGMGPVITRPGGGRPGFRQADVTAYIREGRQAPRQAPVVKLSSDGPEDCTPEFDNSADWAALGGAWQRMKAPGFAGYSVADEPGE